eukprot:5367791-Heterocapsa_arctica.AAC.1
MQIPRVPAEPRSNSAPDGPLDSAGTADSTWRRQGEQAHPAGSNRTDDRHPARGSCQGGRGPQAAPQN